MYLLFFNKLWFELFIVLLVSDFKRKMPVNFHWRAREEIKDINLQKYSLMFAKE